MKKVLVVDDDTDLLEMVQMVLVRHNMNVQIISKGAGLYDSLREIKPDIILMDIFLGDSDGRELCFELKQSQEFKDIPVILYSAGHITSASIRESLADDFLVKPFDISKLVSKIRTEY